MARNKLARALIIGSEIALSAPAVWWIVGLNPSDVAPADADYLIRPLRLPPYVEPAIGLLSLLAIGHAVRSLHRGVKEGDLRREWRQVAAAFAALSAYVGLTYRVATAPVIGANIGAGLLILLALPISIGMLVWAGAAARDMRHPAWSHAHPRTP